MPPGAVYNVGMHPANREMGAWGLSSMPAGYNREVTKGFLVIDVAPLGGPEFCR